jgi:hypothetical protein
MHGSVIIVWFVFEQIREAPRGVRRRPATADKLQHKEEYQ